jgi:hypothetical protein
LPLSTKLRKDIAKALTSLAPGIPYTDAETVKSNAASRHLRSYPPGISVWLSLVAHIRHRHTEYDALLADGYDLESARHFVMNDINAVLTGWRATRLIEDENEA